MKKITRILEGLLIAGAVLTAGGSSAASAGQDLLSKLAAPQDYVSKRVSSYDRSGGNKDSLTIQPGETAVLADLKGPGRHPPHLGDDRRRGVLRPQARPARCIGTAKRPPRSKPPIGDFFGVGHGLDRNVASLPITCSSEGRAPQLLLVHALPAVRPGSP